MANIKDRIKLLDKLHRAERSLMERKAHDYSGDDDCNRNIKACEVMGICPAETGLLVRMLDKLQRLVTLSRAEAKVKDESKEDTLGDLRNYAAIYIHLMRDKSTKASKNGVTKRAKLSKRRANAASARANKGRSSSKG